MNPTNIRSDRGKVRPRPLISSRKLLLQIQDDGDLLDDN